MSAREPAPDGGTGNEPVLVLRENTLVRSYRLCYLGTGGMSIAYRGERGGQTFLVKEVPSHAARKVMALTQEKALLERLDHCAIPKVFDLFEEDGFCYLVKEFIEGSSLHDLIPVVPGVFLQEDVLVDWALQLCETLEYLHRQQPSIIYRDLKPGNIMRDPAGRLHLVDFGIARSYKEGRTTDTQPFGSVSFASPEHYGGAQTDARSDIFTLGATLHHLATSGQGAGREPFEFLRMSSLNPHLSDGFDRVVRKALETDPSLRFQTIGEMRRALVAARAEPEPLHEDEDSSPAPTEGIAATAESGLKPAHSGRMAVAMVVLALAGGWAGWQARPFSSTAPASSPAGSPPAAYSRGQSPSLQAGREREPATPRATRGHDLSPPSFSPPPHVPEPAQVGQSRDGDGTPVSGARGHFRVVIPRGYAQTPTSHADELRFSRGRSESRNDPVRTLCVIVRTGPNPVDPARAVAEHQRELLQWKAVELRVRPTRVSSLSAFEFLYDVHVSTTGLIRRREVLVLDPDGRTAYSLLVDAPRDSFDRFAPEFDRFIQSFSVTRR